MTLEEIKQAFRDFQEIQETGEYKEGHARCEELCKKHGVGCDTEELHSVMDGLLLDYIGDKELIELFDNVDKWYA